MISVFQRTESAARLLCQSKPEQIAALVVGLALGACAHAQSLSELYTHALGLDPAVAGARAQLHAAEQRQTQARAGFGPTAAMVGNYSETRYREAPEYEQRKFQAKQLNLQITQPLLRSALIPSLDSAAAQVEQAKALVDQARADAAQRLVEACFEVLKARDALALARAQRLAIDEQLKSAQHSFRIGTAAIIDVREAEAKADALAAQVSAAEFELDLKLQIVTELTGQSSMALMERGLSGQQLPSLQATATSQWLADAQHGSAQLQQALRALASAEAEVSKAWHGHAPTADLTYAYGRSADTGTFTTTIPRRGINSTVGVSLNVPLFASGATHAKVNEARALRDKALSDVDAARRAVNLNVRQAASATLSAISQAHGLEAAVRSQELALRANRRGYEVGMKVNAEVLDSQSRLFEARRDLSRARYDAWNNFIKLKALAGRLDDGDIHSLEMLLVPVTAESPVSTRQTN